MSDVHERLLTELLERAATARAAGDGATAREQAEQALQLARTHGAPVFLAAALHERGNVAADDGDRDRALSIREEAVEICRGLGDPLRVAHTLRHLADEQRRCGQLDAAARGYREALRLMKPAQAGELAVANAARGLGLVEELRGRERDAAQAWRRARDLYRQAGIDDGVAEAEEHLRPPPA